MFFSDENNEDIMKSFVSDFEDEVDYESDYENHMKTLDEIRNNNQLNPKKSNDNDFSITKTDNQISSDENIEIEGDEEIMEEIINSNNNLENSENQEQLENSENKEILENSENQEQSENNIKIKLNKEHKNKKSKKSFKKKTSKKRIILNW